ncbi:MAG: type II toxin-antitoxin system HicB family antitoxin [Ignavibacteriales bacterium]|nr:type II toxin-antitoxin system HicB family antitoxin [Ignavibacteriales bacterium]
MISDYIKFAMSDARYEIIEDDKTYFGEIPGFEGLWANGKTLEECRNELQETLEEWIVLSLRLNKPLPILHGIDLSVKEVA